MKKTHTIKLLVFPADMDAAIPFLSVAHALGIRVFGASSLTNPPTIQILDQLIQLPYVSEDGFTHAFKRCIETHAITHVYTPHPGVWTLLKELQTEQPRFTLCGPSPYQGIWQDSKPGYDWAESTKSAAFPGFLLAAGEGPKPALSTGEYAALYKQFLRIPGQCDLEKLTAFAHLARVLPPGDLVEIGSFCGRSAFALAWLAGRHDIGNLISIDPWSNQAIEEQGREAGILNRDMESIDFEKIFRIYISNISLLTNAGYIREVSVKGIEDYNRAAAEGFLKSPHLRTIALEGRISLLHIDGNHAFDHVRQDIETWVPRVIPGGWVLLDDYLWAFGDGPKRAGDELLAGNGFDQAFVMGDTLYLRKA